MIGSQLPTTKRRRKRQAVATLVGLSAERPARMIVIEGGRRGSKFLVEDGMTLGRGKAAACYLDAEDISRVHARIHVDGVTSIEDLGSRNGTFVNDVPVDGDQPLQFGDRVRLGAHTILLFTHYDPAETEMMKRRRLELLGRMAAGIAHDVNNLLGALLSTQEYLLNTPEDTTLADQETRECMREIKAAGEQAAYLMPKLLSFARGHSDGHRAFDVSAVCEEVMQLVRRTFDRRVVFETSFEPGIQVMGDRVEIQQVLMNLCVNARDAMSHGGELKVTATSLTDAAAGAARSMVEIEVADTGEGMDEETCRRIFEPFFTTKSEGHGSGLGLATVKETIAVHGGDITVSSSKGHGTAFVIRLPIADTIRAAHRTVAPNIGDTVLPASILVVDDDPLCRKAFARMLTRLGHRVTVADSGATGLRLMEQTSDTPDLVLLDVDMPQMSGEETLEKMRRLAPAVRVIAITGSRDHQRHQAMLDGGALHIVAKPFTQEALCLAMSGALAVTVLDEQTAVSSRLPS